MKQIVIILILFSFLNSLNSQKMVFDKKIIHKLFKKDIKSHGTWVACNKDSLYFKNDTIFLFDNFNYVYYSNDCCNFVEWKFIDKYSIYWAKTQICVEPPVSSVVKFDEIMKLKLLNKKDGLYLNFYRKNQLFDRYKVLMLESTKLWEKGQDSYKLTLQRSKS